MENMKIGIRRLAFVVWFVSLFFSFILFLSTDRLSQKIPIEVIATITIFLATFPWPFYFLGNWVIRGFGQEIAAKKLLYAFLVLIFAVILFLIGLLNVLIKIPKSESPW